MKILTGKDIREADLYTIEHEPVASIDLMERAAAALEAEVVAEAEKAEAAEGAAHKTEYLIFAGKGNNGGDGLALARLLKQRYGDSRRVSAVILNVPEELSADCRTNLERLPESVERYVLADGAVLDSAGNEVAPERLFGRSTVVIDAILGTGVNGAVRGKALHAIRFLNGHSGGCREVISVDLPSGLPCCPDGLRETDASVLLDETGAPSAVSAGLTLTIEFPKLSLLLPESGKFAGRVRTVHIGLDRKFIDSCESPWTAVDTEFAASLLRPRGEFDHKGTHGHVLVIAGSAEYLGAAILCTGAALRSGCGLVSAHIPAEGRTAMLIAHPSAIISAGDSAVFSTLPEKLSAYSAFAVGPGIGRSDITADALKELLFSLMQLDGRRTLVLDADALNIISAHPEMLGIIPGGSVLTPHVLELSRLLQAALESGFIEDADDAMLLPGRTRQAAGRPWRHDMHEILLVRQLSRRLKSVIVVKGAHTMVCSPDGRCFFNMSGNPGMAKGGSGDLLTGLTAGLAARGYDALDAALLAVWFHGRAGDAAAAECGVESMNASDMLRHIKI